MSTAFTTLLEIIGATHHEQCPSCGEMAERIAECVDCATKMCEGCSASKWLCEVCNIDLPGEFDGCDTKVKPAKVQVDHARTKRPMRPITNHRLPHR